MDSTSPISTLPRPLLYEAFGVIFAMIAAFGVIMTMSGWTFALPLALLVVVLPLVWNRRMRAVLARTGGPFDVPAIREHGAAALQTITTIWIPFALVSLGQAGTPDWTWPPPPPDLVSRLAPTVMYLGLGLTLFVMVVSLLNAHRKHLLARPAWERWYARQKDPRIVRWSAIRDRADTSERTRALATDVLRELDGLLDTPADPRLAELDLAADRIEQHLAPADAGLAHRFDEAIAELDAVAEVERDARARAHAARSRQTS